MNSEIELTGIDGSNPLAFLAALGVLRTLTLAKPGHQVKMSWRPAGAWLPVVHADLDLTESEIARLLHERLSKMANHPAFSLANNLDVPPEDFRAYCQQAAASDDRSWADFASAFGCDATTTSKGKGLVIQDTALRTMSGAGHQDFLRFIRNIVAATGADHYRKALFEPWRYEDPARNLTMRWDPNDDSRYALRWGDPSKDPTRQTRGSVLGANRLAIEGLPLLPTVPVGAVLVTTGFRGRGARETFWTWPIWEGPLTVDVVRSLLAMPALQQVPPPRDALATMGIVEVYRSQRLTVGKFRSFAPAEPT